MSKYYSKARIVGVNRLIKRLNLIPEEVFDEAEKAITEHTKDIAEEAVQLAPEDGGELGRKIKAKKTRRTKTKVTGTVGSNANHSMAVEYGTANQEAQPFLRPAARKGDRLEDLKRRVQAAFQKK
jgi:HK97 gp10 family phage protein